MQWAHVLCHKGKHTIKTWLAISLGVQGSKKSSLYDMHNFAYFIFVQGAATFQKGHCHKSMVKNLLSVVEEKTCI